jgi:hypothetical protein
METTSPQEKATVEHKLIDLEKRITKIEDIVFHIDVKKSLLTKQQLYSISQGADTHETS